MHIRRDIAHAPRTRTLGHKIAHLQGGCVGCKDCTGLCATLIEALTLPDLVLKEKQA